MQDLPPKFVLTSARAVAQCWHVKTCVLLVRPARFPSSTHGPVLEGLEKEAVEAIKDKARIQDLRTKIYSHQSSDIWTKLRMDNSM